MEYRKACAADIPLLAELRKKQLADEGIAPDKDIDAELVRFFSEKLADGTLVQWLVEDAGKVVACAAVVFYDFPPTYTNRTGRKAYVTNMYTAPAHRGRGIGTALLDVLAEEARRAGVAKMWLGASRLGRPVYQKFGFRQTDEWMELDL